MQENTSLFCPGHTPSTDRHKKNTDKPNKQVCILLTFCYASNQAITLAVTTDLFYATRLLHYFSSTHHSQSKKCHFHFLHSNRLVNLLSDKVIESQPIAFKLCFKNSNFPHYQVSTEFSSWSLATSNTRSLVAEATGALRYFKNVCCLHRKHVEFENLSTINQGRNEEGQGGHNSPGANSLRGRRKVPTMSQVLSSIQQICIGKSSASNMGAPNFDHGGAKLVFCAGRHLTLLLPCYLPTYITCTVDPTCFQIIEMLSKANRRFSMYSI